MGDEMVTPGQIRAGKRYGLDLSGCTKTEAARQITRLINEARAAREEKSRNKLTHSRELGLVPGARIRHEKLGTGTIEYIERGRLGYARVIWDKSISGNRRRSSLTITNLEVIPNEDAAQKEHPFVSILV